MTNRTLDALHRFRVSHPVVSTRIVVGHPLHPIDPTQVEVVKTPRTHLILIGAVAFQRLVLVADSQREWPEQVHTIYGVRVEHYDPDTHDALSIA